MTQFRYQVDHAIYTYIYIRFYIISPTTFFLFLSPCLFATLLYLTSFYPCKFASYLPFYLAFAWSLTWYEVHRSAEVGGSLTAKARTCWFKHFKVTKILRYWSTKLYFIDRKNIYIRRLEFIYFFLSYLANMLMPYSSHLSINNMYYIYYIALEYAINSTYKGGPINGQT